MRKPFKNISDYKSFGILFLLLLIFERLFNFAFNAVVPLFFKGIKYTPGHFRPPSFPSTVSELYYGVGEFFGTVPAMLAVPLVLFYLILLVIILSLLKGRFGAGLSNLAGWSRAKGLKLSDGNRKKAGVILMLILAAAFSVKTFSLKPLSNDVSFLGKAGIVASFYFDFNKALVAKARFNEELYRDTMLKALKRDGGEYFRFADTSYWAYFSKDGQVKKTERDIFASVELNAMFNEGLLGEADIFEAYKLNRRLGNNKKAGSMVKYLQRTFPENSEYAIENDSYSGCC